jgi:8-oxo-dGTP pyrophosphatase MutT (NUDIX family)
LLKKEISAGGLVYQTREGQLLVQMIQDRYGRITLPKGKMESGETVRETALREILEETGIQGRIIAPLELIHYRFHHPDAGDVDKEVHYFLVEAVGGELHAQIEEIRGVEWMTPQEAWKNQRQMGYENNDSVVRKGLQQIGYEVESI